MDKLQLLIIGLLVLACNQLEKEYRPTEANMICSDFYVQGQYKYGAYTFCGTIPKEIEYVYKEGKWRYWNLKGQLIAEGVYQEEKRIIDNEGGCSYEITESKMVEEEWIFWDDEGKQIKPNYELIEKLNICSRIENIKDA